MEKKNKLPERQTHTKPVESVNQSRPDRLQAARKDRLLINMKQIHVFSSRTLINQRRPPQSRAQTAQGRRLGSVKLSSRRAISAVPRRVLTLNNLTLPTKL